MDAEFEVQAEIFMSLRTAGFEVNGEVAFTDSRTRRRRADIVVWCPPTELAIEVKKDGGEVSAGQLSAYCDRFAHTVSVCGPSQGSALVASLVGIGPGRIADHLREHGIDMIQSEVLASRTVVAADAAGQRRAMLALTQLLTPKCYLIEDRDTGHETMVSAATVDDAVDAMLRQEERDTVSMRLWGEGDRDCVSVVCRREHRWSIVKCN